MTSAIYNCIFRTKKEIEKALNNYRKANNVKKINYEKLSIRELTYYK